MTKKDAYFTCHLLRVLFKFLKIKKTSTLVKYIVWFLKSTYKDELHQSSNNLEDVCLFVFERITNLYFAK